MIKYIGSKRTLVPRIVALAESIRERAGATRIADLFSGTTRVAQGLKRAGFHVTANDTATYSEVLAIAYVEHDGERRAPTRRRKGAPAGLSAKFAHLNALPGTDGYVTRTFCEEARYFQPFNGRRIDAIRAEIDRIAEGRVERAILLTSLLEAADRVDSTTGLQMAYLKEWAPRSFNAIELRMPALIPGTGRAVRRDANLLAPRLRDIDIAYLDPPYNQHSYFSNYHIWETVVRGDAPDTYGVARKRTDCREMKSAYNSRARAWMALENLVRGIRAPHLVVSFSDEGFLEFEQIAQLLEDARGEVAVIPVDFKRYVGAQIGIYNPRGEKVGKVSHLRNREFLFVAGEGARRIVRASKAA